MRTEIELDERWSIGGRPHGGYLLRETVTPAVTEQHPHPLAVSAHFLRSPLPGPATVEVTTLRIGRRVSQHRARLLQGGESVVETLVTCGVLTSIDPYWSSSVAPELPPPSECPRSVAEPIPGFRIGHLDVVDVRPTSVPPPAGTVQAWLQMTSGITTALDLLVLADALAPVPMALAVPGWFPTVELTAYLRALPAPGWLVGEQHATVLHDGWFDEDCTIWDSTGHVVCQASQLAGYRL